jgi:hypothetical protein
MIIATPGAVRGAGDHDGAAHRGVSTGALTC